MDFIHLMIALIICCGTAFYLGRLSKQHPSEEEMIERIVRSRLAERIENEIAQEVQGEISRRANYGPKNDAELG